MQSTIPINIRNTYTTSGKSSTIPTLVDSGSSCTCSNVLEFAHYFITPSLASYGTIGATVADIFTTDITAATCDTPIKFNQKFAVTFIQATSVPIYLTNK